MRHRKGLVLAVAALFLFETQSPSHAAITLTFVSHAAGDALVSSDGSDPFLTPTLSPNGRYVTFTSTASNLIADFVDNNTSIFGDVYRFDRTDGSMVLVSQAHDSTKNGAAGPVSAPAVSDDGSVFFLSDGDNHVNTFVDNNANDPDLFVFDGATEAIRLLSGAARSATLGANGGSDTPFPSDDGTRVSFQSSATDLDSFVDGNGGTDAFLVNVADLAVSLVSHALPTPTTSGNGTVTWAILSGDGSHVVFASNALNHIGGFANNNGSNTDLYRYTVSSGAIQLISHASTSPTAGANQDVPFGLPSTNGGSVVYLSNAENLITGFVNGNLSSLDAYIFQASSGNSRLVSHIPGDARAGSDGDIDAIVPSAAGKHVLLGANSTDLIQGFNDGNAGSDLYLFSLSSGSNKLISRRTGSGRSSANSGSYAQALRFNPTSFTFGSDATDIIAGFTNNGPGPTTNVYRYSKKPGKKPKTQLVSHAHDDARGGADDACRVGRDAVTATVTGFACLATNLVSSFTANVPPANNAYTAP
jgi:hypothetical protein